MEKKSHGGFRAGAGGPKGEPSTSVNFRIPIRLKEIFKARVREVIKELKAGGAEKGA